MKLTYCITVCDEYKEFTKLYETLRINKQQQDEILVLADLYKCTPGGDLWLFLNKLENEGSIIWISDWFNGNFSNWKNKLIDYPIQDDYKVFLDADELLPPQLIDDLPTILELNPAPVIFGLARQNFVKGITPEDIQNWSWRVDEKLRINWPDYQKRILKSNSNVRWVGTVHETLIGDGLVTALPAEPEFSILHRKDIVKQRRQNESYNTGNYTK